jgi:transposase
VNEGGAHIAIECFKQTADSKFFEAWFENSLLRVIPRGYTVIMDNAGFHRKSILRKIVRGKARILFLPPYSPDYNPIEKTWANMKRYLRSNPKDYPSVDSAIYQYFGVKTNQIKLL